MNLAMEMHRAFLAGKSMVRKWKFPHLELTLCCKALKTIAKPLGFINRKIHFVVYFCSFETHSCWLIFEIVI